MKIKIKLLVGPNAVESTHLEVHAKAISSCWNCEFCKQDETAS